MNSIELPNTIITRCTIGEFMKNGPKTLLKTPRQTPGPKKTARKKAATSSRRLLVVATIREEQARQSVKVHKTAKLTQPRRKNRKIGTREWKGQPTRTLYGKKGKIK